ncbi:hypothetical protein ACFYP4_16945 [Streptomyces sp. NPDC005551]|uniref:hypothetical protein n=1 Tax=unclassified Streptomyces TaxID=2593676 RepID=UPI0034112D1C
MRKLRKAAVVTAMIGCVSTFGAGVASAEDGSRYGDDTGGDSGVTLCEQSAEVPQNTVQNGLINLGSLGLLGTGSAPSSAIQQICAGGDVDAANINDSEPTGGLLNLGLGL